MTKDKERKVTFEAIKSLAQGPEILKKIDDLDPTIQMYVIAAYGFILHSMATELWEDEQYRDGIDKIKQAGLDKLKEKYDTQSKHPEGSIEYLLETVRNIVEGTNIKAEVVVDHDHEDCSCTAEDKERMAALADAANEEYDPAMRNPKTSAEAETWLEVHLDDAISAHFEIKYDSKEVLN